MRRILLRLAVALVTFTLGLSVTTFYGLYRLPEVTKLEGPTPSSCFPGLSVRIVKPTSPSAYFPPVAISENALLNEFRIDWYSMHLLAMNEAALPSLVKEEESYRFLWLRSFHHPIAIHVWRSGSKQFIVAKRLSGAGGYKPRTLNINNTRQLSDDEWSELMMHLEDSRFWQMSTADDRMSNDGAQWILEGYRQGRYHLVDRQCPDLGGYREACLYLLRISGLLYDIPWEEVY